jgi:hypothetical protein
MGDLLLGAGVLTATGLLITYISKKNEEERQKQAAGMRRQKSEINQTNEILKASVDRHKQATANTAQFIAEVRAQLQTPIVASHSGKADE